MKCPHCNESFHEDPLIGRFIKTTHGQWALDYHQETKDPVDGPLLRINTCPECKNPIVQYGTTVWGQGQGNWNGTALYRASPNKLVQVFPSQPGRKPKAFLNVGPGILTDYTEACAVLDLSPRASAALSRRCLQAILLEAGKVDPKKDLSKQIDEVYATLPGYIQHEIDAVRNFGNFGAHPITDKASGAVVDVEPGEAEWCLEIIEGLFDHYYEKPAQSKARKAALDAKLQSAGKPPAK